MVGDVSGVLRRERSAVDLVANGGLDATCDYDQVCWEYVSVLQRDRWIIKGMFCDSAVHSHVYSILGLSGVGKQANEIRAMCEEIGSAISLLDIRI